jgi:hypothetical protein
MSDQPHKPLPIPKIRTFAGDLKNQRNKRNPEEEPDRNQVDEKVSENKTPKTSVAVDKKPIPIPKLIKLSDPLTQPKKVEKKSDSPLKNTTIPAYHELQKKINKIDKDSKSKQVKTVAPIKVGKPLIKKVSPEKAVKKNNIGYDATIITDTKKHNPDFFPTIIKAISDWVQKILTPKPKAAPKYTIADSSTRKGVIQKATTKTGSIFTADNESLKDQIRKRRLEEAHQANVKADEVETNWSPYTEPGYDLLESPDNTSEIYTPIPKVPEASNPTPEPKLIIPPTEIEVDFDEQRWSTPDIPKPASPSPQITAENATFNQEPDVVEVPREKEDDSAESNEEVIPDKKIDVEEEEPENKKVLFEESIEGVDTNTMSVMVLMVIIGLVSVVLVGRLVYQYLSSTAEEAINPPVRVIGLLENSTLSSLPLTTSDLNNIGNLIDEKRLNSSEPILEIALTDADGNELSAAYIFELLDFSMMPTMRQSITSVRFVSVDKKEELVIIKFNNEENVRGGFLNWETELSADLNELYDTSLSNNDFSDKQTASLDTRELISDDGTIITYSIVNDTTALISINKNDLERIINLEFKP